MRVIGLMSGTSVDGIDAALVQISGSTTDLTTQLIQKQTFPYPSELRRQILAVCRGQPLSLGELAKLDDSIAFQFASAANILQSNCGNADLIGSHGQTVYHSPPIPYSVKSTAKYPEKVSLGYTVQLGRGALIATQTGCPTVSNFRIADVAMGGHGAPLVPPVDHCLLGHSRLSRCVQNIGGIGNVTYLPSLEKDDDVVRGWDTGPGNALLDLAVHYLSNGDKTYDLDGLWARKGTVDSKLVNQWLEHPFFHQSPPKSTGRELFGEAYWKQCYADAQGHGLTAADILATMTELTVASIEHSYQTFLPRLPDQVLICGGGSRNTYLVEQLRSRLTPSAVITTDDVGLDADFKEAIAFAVLAYWRWRAIPGNLPVVTGALHPVPLGEIYLPPQLDKDQMKVLMEKIRLTQ